MPTLTWDDLKAIRAEVPGVRCVAPRLHTTGQVVTEDQNWATLVTGTTPEFFEIRNWPIRLGSGITAEDVDAGAKVAVLGETVAGNLFGASADPVGQIVRIQNVPFQVVGVAERKGQSPGGSDYDDVVYVPVSTFLAKIQGGPAEATSPARSWSRSPATTRPPPSPRASRRCCAIATTSPPAPTTTSRSRT